MSCSTCHAAHQPVGRAASAAGYDGVCASCHKQAKHRAVAVVGKSCVGCHMPVVAPNNQLRFANHWIGVYAPGAPLRPISRRP